MGSPLELVGCRNDKWEVGKEAIAALRRVKGAVGVVAVCGRARQGKSYILNQLLKQASGGFQVGSTQKPCTKGLWMWSEPVKHTMPDGSVHHLVLLDTEGIDAYDQTHQYSTQIFCLAVLLSSMFVFNQMGGIDEPALEKLHLVSEMTKRVQVRASKQDDVAPAEELAQFTPSFLWLLRDFYLRLADDGKQITAQQYLESTLEEVPEKDDSTRFKNQIRQSIKALFPDRDCCVLVRPMAEEAELTNLNTIAHERLRPEFRKGLEQLTRRIFSKSRPRRIGNQLVTGPILAGLVEAYVKAINQGAVPVIATAWQGVAESECRKGVDAAEAVYVREFKEDQAATEEVELEREYQRAFQMALSTFQDIAVGDPGVVAAHQQRLVQACESRYQQAKKTWMAQAEAAVNKLVYDANVELSKVLRSSNTNYQQLCDLLTSFLEVYQSNTSGPSKWPRLIEFLKNSFIPATQELASKYEARMKHEMAEAKKTVQESALQMQQLQQGNAELQQKLQQTSQRAVEVDSMRTELARREAESRVSQDKSRFEVEALKKELEDVRALTKKKLDASDKEAGAKIQQAEAVLAQMRRTREEEHMKVTQLSNELQIERVKRQSLETQVQAYLQEVEQLRHNSAAAVIGASDKDKQIATLQESVTRLQADLAAVTLQRDQVQQQLSQQQSTRMEMENTLDECLAEAQEATVNSTKSRGVRRARDEFEAMTITQLRDWLTQHGFDEEVWENRNYKKGDWVKLAREKSALIGQSNGATA